MGKKSRNNNNNEKKIIISSFVSLISLIVIFLNIELENGCWGSNYSDQFLLASCFYF